MVMCGVGQGWDGPYGSDIGRLVIYCKWYRTRNVSEKDKDKGRKLRNEIVKLNL